MTLPPPTPADPTPEDLRAALSAAEAASRAKDEFLAVVSHELRTPLNAILGWAQVLRAASDLSGVAEAVAVIERNARVQARLIDDLLDLSRVSSGQVSLDTRRMELGEVVEAAIDAVVPEAVAKHVKIDVAVEPFVAPVMGDPARLQQVFSNLIHNAIKYTPEGGRIRVAVDADDAEAVVTVSDNGVGIEPDALPHIFDRYRQGNPNNRKTGGLGLGLAIVKHLVEMHGGKIRAESGGAHQGSTFTVSLPLAVLFEGAGAAASSLPPPPAAVRSGPPRLDGAAILVVDDEADARRFVALILRNSGAAVVTAGSMEEALAEMEGSAFDLLVSDIAMPGHDGYELIHRVRQRGADKGGLIRALALTAFAHDTDLRRSLGAGFNMHVSKPVDATDLLTAAARLLGPRFGVKG